MKMILAILKDDDVDSTVHGLTAAQYRVTRVASTGGFFRKGNTTLMIGVEASKVDAAIELIRQSTTPSADGGKRATIFVVPVAHFEQI